MTSKERFLTAIQNKIPDRVPVTPDISYYIPCKLHGGPYWDILFHNDPPLWKAHLKAVDYFGTDAWIASVTGPPMTYDNNQVESKVKIVYNKDRDAMIRDITYHTPDGALTSQEVCFRYDPPSPTIKLIKNLKEDWKKFKWLTPLQMPTGIDNTVVEEIRSECKKRDQAFGLMLSYPGFHMWSSYVQGGVEPLAYAQMDVPEILTEWFELDMEIGTKIVELLISVKPDYITFGGSGTLALSSPELVMEYTIPALRKWSKMTKQANIPTMLHSCGKSCEFVEMLVNHTDVNCINPLEVPPMGDVNLAELKGALGSKIALMGNLHTTEVMLMGNVESVYSASIQAMRDAGGNGGFILSSGDQCGRETPEENIFAMVEAVNKFGFYDQRTGKLPELASFTK